MSGFLTIMAVLLTVPTAAFGIIDPWCVAELLSGWTKPVPVEVAPEPPPEPPEVQRRELLDYLSEDGRERRLVEYLSKTKWLRELFEYNGQCVGWHTRMVLDECAKKWKYVDWSAIKVPEGFALAAVVKVALALHDIGKGTREFWRRRTLEQHDLTVPILEKAMAELGFAPEEIALAVALVGHDIVGLTIQRRVPVAAAYEALAARQKTTVLSPKDFFRVQTFFYAADVASYSHLDDVLDRQGKFPVSPLWRQLAEKF